jgi:hypothetical protein
LGAVTGGVGAGLLRQAAVQGGSSFANSMINRTLSGENPFDPAGLKQDLLMAGMAAVPAGRIGISRLADEVPGSPPRYVYRGGSATDVNLTPSPSKDPGGLSTFDTLERATEPGGKAQVIDTTRLRNLEAIPDPPPPGHVSIRPHDPTEIPAWAATKESGETHPYTQEVRDAIERVERRPR